MAEKPILFSTEMVKAIMDNRKTQTRRVVKPQPELFYTIGKQRDIVNSDQIVFKAMVKGGSDKLIIPPCQPGDILWVRETWYYESHMYDESEGDALYRYVYKANQHNYPVNVGVGEHGWKPSIHMPREAARLFLQVKNVRVERLQDITEEDAIAEGIVPYDTYTAKRLFMNLWNALNSKRGLIWASSPWVWVIEFERVTS